MKLRTLLIATVLGFGALATTTTAKADCERTRVVYDDCGRPVYLVYRVVGYDCHGCPIGRWVRTCPPAPTYCEPPVYHHHHHDHCDSGPSFSFGHGGFSVHVGH